MVMRWMDGGELWGSAAKAARAYLSSTGLSYPTGDPRITPGVRSISSNGGHQTTPSLGVQNSWVVGFGLQAPSSAAGGWQFRFLNAAAEQLRLQALADGVNFELRIMRGATEVAVTNEDFAPNLWHYFEFSATLTNTGSYELRHNEQNVLSDAGPVDLQDLGSSGADGFSWFHNTGGTSWDMDDLWINDSTGSVNNDFLGDTVLFALKPTADQSVQWTPEPSSPTSNWDKVDEAGDTSSDSDWVETDTNTDTDLYEFANVPATGIGTIHAVKLSFNGRMETAGSSTLTSKFRDSGGSTADGDDVVFDGTAFVEEPVIFDEEPVAMSAWTASAIDGGRFGMERFS